MTESTTSPQEAWSYAAFIAALKPLIEEAKAFTEEQRDRESPSFRQWRHAVTSLCTKIARSHNDSTCGVEHRPFTVNGYSTDFSSQKLKAFNRDLADTLVELQHIIKHYEQFGEPSMKNTPAAAAMKTLATQTRSPTALLVPGPVESSAVKESAPPEWPKAEKVTLKWLWDHMPLKAWGLLLASLGTAFALGSAACTWPIIQRWLTGC